MDLTTNEHEEEAVFEPTLEMGQEACAAMDRHSPRRVFADNGFTHETICGRCGISL